MQYNTSLYNTVKYGANVSIISLSDSESSSDTLVKEIDLIKIETLSLSESINLLNSFYRTFVESNNLTDSIAIFSQILKTESISLSDLLTASFAFSLSDSFNVEDTSFDRIVTFLRTYLESSFGVYDYDYLGPLPKAVFKPIADSTNLVEIISKELQLNKSEHISTADLTGEVPGSGFLDSLIINDAYFRDTIKQLSETINSVENLTLKEFLLKIEQVAINESVQIGFGNFPLLLDNLNFSEQIGKVSAKVLIDFVFLTDYFAHTLPAITFSEFVKIKDWIEFNFVEPTSWNKQSINSDTWDKQQLGHTNWLKESNDPTNWTKENSDPSNWAKEGIDNASWDKEAKDSANWTKDSPDNASWTKKNKDNANWTKPIPDSSTWSK